MNTKEISVKYLLFLTQHLCKNKEVAEIFFNVYAREGIIFSNTFKYLHKLRTPDKNLFGVMIKFVSVPEYKFEQHIISKVNE
jgi:hypothetical protein